MKTETTETKDRCPACLCKSDCYCIITRQIEILHSELIQEHTYAYRKVEVWDEKINDLNAKFKCSRCNKVNISTVGFGSAGLCIHCDGIDYWDLIEVEIDGEFKPLKSAFRILWKRKLIHYENEKYIKRTEYKFKENEK